MKLFSHSLPLVLAAGLAGCATYKAKPLSAVSTAADFRSRELSDPGLLSYVAAHHRGARTGAWDLPMLTLVAFYFHPDLDVARAKLRLAEAAVRTAGARPNPSVGFRVDRNLPVLPGVSPWIYQPTLDLPIETAGKRRQRISQAGHLTEAERMAFAGTAWTVRSRLRSRLIEHLLAREELESLQGEEASRAESATMAETRAAAGDLSRELASVARIDLNRVRQLRQAAEGKVEETRIALAAGVGVPTSALTGVHVVSPQLASPPTGRAASRAAVQSQALLNRLDIRRGLAEYAATEAALRLEIAKQYPDFQLTPGYRWTDSQQRWRLGVSIELPVFDQNQGPIAEARARRELAGASFLAMQASVIAEVEGALARYRSALQGYALAGEILGSVKEREKKAEQAFALGDIDQAAVSVTRLETATARRDQLTALRAVQTALGALEDAMQRPLDGPPTPPPVERPANDSRGPHR